jgi:hypothetical protein
MAGTCQLATDTSVALPGGLMGRVGVPLNGRRCARPNQNSGRTPWEGSLGDPKRSPAIVGECHRNCHHRHHDLPVDAAGLDSAPHGMHSVPLDEPRSSQIDPGY